MMGLFTGIILIFIIYLLGYPALLVCSGRSKAQKYGVADQLLHGSCVLLGVAEAAHLAAVFLSLSVSVMAFVLVGLLAAGCAGAILIHRISLRRQKRSRQAKDRVILDVPGKLPKGVEKGCVVLLLLSVLFQMNVIAGGSYRGGDMTFETVQTFLTENALYTHNPLTGQAYELGVPFRLKILGLPGLYASLCSLTGVDVMQMIGIVIPVLVLLGSYVAYYRLGKTLWKENRMAVTVMLLVVSALIWCGGYLVSMDGFQLLFCGYRGTAIRNGILVPFVLSMCLERRYRSALLGILAEACIVWTLYGLGSCVVIAFVMCVLQWMGNRREEKECWK